VKADRAISSRAKTRSGRRIAAIVFGAFVVIGSVVSWFLFVRPLMRVDAAESWAETPCTVVSSEVESHAGSDSTTYSVHIVYRYEVEGQEYTSERYDFLGGSSSGYEGKARIVAQHPPGKKTVCYVNPEDPAEAVLDRTFGAKYLLGLIPVAFVLIGLVGLLATAFARRRVATGQLGPTWLPESARAALAPTPDGYRLLTSAGPITVRPTSSARSKFIGVTIFAVFWNGIVSIFVWQVVEGFRSGSPEWFLTIFMIPFVLVGLGAIGAVFYFLLALFNPRPVLTVSSESLPLGGTLDLDWALVGRTRAVQRLTLYLEGREEATYRRGTDTVTDKHVFTTVPVADTTDRYEILAGKGQVAVPPDTMHSFQAPNNKIVWALHVHADVVRWPDVKAEFPIAVLPLLATEEGTP